MKTPLTRRRRRPENPQQLTFTFPTAAATPRPPIRDTPFTKAAGVPNTRSPDAGDLVVAAASDFESGKPTRVITRACLDHLANSRIFAAVADDPRPTGSGE